MPSRPAPALVLALAVASSASAQVTVTFRDGEAPTPAYAGTRDVSIRDGTDTPWQPGVNYDGFTNSACGAPDLSATLLRWDLSSVPPGSIVTAASISLWIYDETAAPYPLYEVLRPWTAASATFDTYDGTNPWQTAGAQGAADRGSLVLGDLVGGTGAATFSLNLDGVAVIQAWIDGARPNNGFIVQDYASLDSVGFSTFEDINAANRPTLHLVLEASVLDISAGTDVVIANATDPQTRNGNGGWLNYDGSPQASTLLAWDVSAIPPWSTVSSASVTLDQSDPSTWTYPVYESLADWSETGATWLSSSAGTPWAVPGADSLVDHGAAVLAQLTGSGLVTAPFADAGVDLVQGWVSGARPNRGVHIVSYANGDGVWAPDREDPSVSLRPALTVTYREGQLAFAQLPAVAGVASSAGPFALERRTTGGAAISTGAPDLALTLSVASPTAALSLDGNTGWTSTLVAHVLAGQAQSEPFFLLDTAPEDVSVTASANAAWSGAGASIRVRRADLTAPGSIQVGTPASATLQVIGPAGAAAEITPVELEVVPASTDAGFSSSSLSLVTGQLASGNSRADGTADGTFVTSVAGSFEVCGRIAQAADSGSCVPIVARPGPSDRIALETETPVQTGCAEEPVDLRVLDAFGNTSPAAVWVSLCADGGSAPAYGATTLASEVRSGSCVSGWTSDAGLATAFVGPTSAGVVQLSASSSLAGAPPALSLEWRAGPASPVRTAFALSDGGTSTAIDAHGGTAEIDVLPKDDCDFDPGLAAASLALVGANAFQVTGPAPLATGFRYSLALGSCPGNAPLSIGATVDGAPLVDAVGEPRQIVLQPQCTAPAFGSTPPASVRCGEAWQYAPSVTGDGPMSFSTTGAPAGLELDAASGALAWTPPGNAPSGTSSFVLHVSGPGGTAQQAIDVSVSCEPQDLLVTCGCSESSGAMLAAALVVCCALRGRASQYSARRCRRMAMRTGTTSQTSAEAPMASPTPTGPPANRKSASDPAPNAPVP